MNSLAALLTPLVLLLPALAADRPALPGRTPNDQVVLRAAPEPAAAGDVDPSVTAAMRVFDDARVSPVVKQVRIQERVIIRIAPSKERALQQSMARLAREADDFEEQRATDCIPIGGIAGVYPSRENRLLLLMRDRRVMSAALERACNAADYYAGFYVERSEDGQLCSRRDRLQSRAGASCRVTRLSRLAASED
jgi:hypothetical protein